MSQSPANDVAKNLRPVVFVVVAAKVGIISVLFAGLAGVLPLPATSTNAATVYVASE